MVDPYAPPAETLAPTRPPTAVDAGGQAYETPYDQTYGRETPRDRRIRHERDRPREMRPEPARPGLFWAVAAIGVGILCLARLMEYFAVQDTLANDQVVPALFGTLGIIALSAGLALAAVLQRGLAVPWRIALLLGAGFFAVVGWDGLGFVSLL